MARTFRGVINVDVRDSVADWEPYTPPRAPAGAPNVLLMLYDDTGLAAWEPFGGRVAVPALRRLADNGLRYSQWHTAALCSATRSSLLTGRNPHQNGSAGLAGAPTGFPGSHGRIPAEHAFLAEVLRRRGWGTFWLGKNQNVPGDERGPGASRANWPLARGFDRFYGFLGGQSDQWYPNLVEDNHQIDQPYLPEAGYHLSKDLADQAIRFLRDSHQSAPDKPWFMFFCPAAGHAPHHAPPEWINRYRGRFDDGYDAYRQWALPRMVERGILPAGTGLAPAGGAGLDRVPPWSSLNPAQRRLFSRMAEAYAGFVDYTDHQVGRLIDHLAATGQLDNTLIICASDNGASGEGTPYGTVNANRTVNRWPADEAEEAALLDEMGGPATYSHFPTGWAAAFSTPFRMFKRYCYEGGVCAPLVVHWPAGIRARGQVRHQYHHAIDIVPTVLDCCGVRMPEEVHGRPQPPLPGVSMRYTFDAPHAPTVKRTQYFAALGTRGIWHEGWKAVAAHGPASGRGRFDLDRWQLFHTDSDRAEVYDQAAAQPEKLHELVNIWFREAGRFDVLPLDDRTLPELLIEERAEPGGPQIHVFAPGAAAVPEQDAPDLRGRSFRIVSEVRLDHPDACGVLLAQGSRFGGHTLFVKDRRLYYVNNFLAVRPEQQFVSNGLNRGRYRFEVEFRKDRLGEHPEAIGTTRLSINDRVVAEGPMRTQPGQFSLTGHGLCVGRDDGDAVSTEYRAPFPFTGGQVLRVEVMTAADQQLDLAAQAAAILTGE